MVHGFFVLKKSVMKLTKKCFKVQTPQICGATLFFSVKGRFGKDISAEAAHKLQTKCSGEISEKDQMVKYTETRHTSNKN